MAVDVIRNAIGGTSEQTESYADGSSFEIEDGHLVVRAAASEGKRYGKKLAAFAPGSWKFARVTDAK